MTPDEIKAKLKSQFGLPDDVVAGMTDDEAKAALDGMGGAATEFASKFAGCLPARYADGFRGQNQSGQVKAMWAKDPDGDGAPSVSEYDHGSKKVTHHSADDGKPDDDAKFAARFSKMFSDALTPLTQRMGAMEAAIGESQKTAAASMSTMSAIDKTHQSAQVKRVEQAVEAAWLARKLDPAGKARLLEEGKALASRSTFAAGENAELAAWLDKVAKLGVHPFARDTIPDAQPAKPGPVAARLGHNGQAILAGLKQDAPRAFKRLTEPAAAA